jgi:hypothetical protein
MQLVDCVTRITFPAERLVDGLYSGCIDSALQQIYRFLILLKSWAMARALQKT